jgi:hypothetical protein
MGIPDRAGNVAVFGDVPVSVEWTSGTELVVHASGTVYKAEKRAWWARVKYEGIARDGVVQTGFYAAIRDH